MNAADIASSLAGAIGANDNEATVTHYLSTGYPELNYALSSRWDGGAAVGRVIEISGPPSAGKTAIATAMMADAQRQGGIAGFNDHERSFSMHLASRLGLDITPGKFVYKKPRTFEDSIAICTKAAIIIREKKLIPKDAPIAWAFDSLASMVPQSALIDAKTGKDKEFTDRNMNDNTALARATSAHFPAFSQQCEELGICAMFLNQVRMKLGVVYGDPRTTPGGDSPKFYASQRVMLSASMIKKGTGAEKEVIGSQVSAQVIKNKVSRPFLGATWRFEFQPDGSGKFNFYRSMVDFLAKEKLIASAGPRLEWKGGKFYAADLADRLETAGEWNELIALLPEAYKPEVVAIAEEDAA